MKIKCNGCGRVSSIDELDEEEDGLHCFHCAALLLALSDGEILY